MNKKLNNLQHSVLEKIKNGEVAMKPRWHFVLKSALVLVGLGLIALTVLYLLSFVFFMLHQNGVFFVPMFGLQGLFVFVYSSPWLLISLAVVFIVLLELLVCRYSFGYKKPLLYTVLGIVLFTSVGSYAISQTSLHARLYQFAEEGRLPVMHKLYKGYGDAPLEHVHVGVITAMEEKTYYISDRHEGALEVRINENTKVSRQPFEIGSKVLIIGKREGDVVEAVGIRPADKIPRRLQGQEGRPPMPKHWMREGAAPPETVQQ